MFPDVFQPIRVLFQKGIGQKFCQPSGTGINSGFFEFYNFSKSSLEEDVFPLVICAETYMRTSADESLVDSMLDVSPHMQITQAILEKVNGGGSFQVKVDHQILWINGVRYELRELYGIGSSGAAGFGDNDTGKECVICMTELKDTAVLPCRHLVRFYFFRELVFNCGGKSVFLLFRTLDHEQPFVLVALYLWKSKLCCFVILCYPIFFFSSLVCLFFLYGLKAVSSLHVFEF